jgi:hypothetical protein
MQEFVIALTLVAFICGTAVYLSFLNSSELEDIRTSQAAFSLCRDIAAAVDETWTLGYGAEIRLALPEKMNFQDYTAKSSQSSIIVLYQDNSAICRFSANLTNGTSNAFDFPKASVNFYNNNQQVVVSLA